MPIEESVQEVLTELSGYALTASSLSTGQVNLIREQISGLTDIWLVVGGVFCFFWILALIWVIKDSNARSENLGFQFFAAVIVVILTPVFGLPLYIACRPQGRKRDKSEWRQALLANLQACPNCEVLNSIENSCCVACGDALKQTCRECGESYSNSYDYCPICGAPNIEK
ncbi:MAG: hypothetical protein LBD11_07420 [Candidatus Peribacteria bacterium]|nr:hypothetical protein [Candidatus Peribacteria bacterium]